MADLSQSSWSETDANNNQTAPLGWTPGVMLPTQVEPTAQAMMGAMKRWWNRQNPIYAATLTTTDTYVVTPQTPVTSFTSFELWRVRMPSANVTTSPTITWGPSAATIQKYNNGSLVNLALGDIQAQYYEFFFNNTVMVMINPLGTVTTPGGSTGQLQINSGASTFAGLPVIAGQSASSGTLVLSAAAAAATTYSWISAPSVAATNIQMPSGSVIPYAGIGPPSGWLICDGSAVSRTTYATLFSTISTTFGSGDGSTTFNVPDLRGRSPFGVDNMGGTAANRVTSAVSGISGATLGAAGGDQNLQSHSHTVGSIPNPTGATNNLTGGTAGSYYTFTTSTAGAGASQNMPPALMLNYIIKT